MTPLGYEFTKISAQEHPFYLPNFIDALNYSIPAVLENLAEMCLKLLALAEEEDVEEEEEDNSKRKTISANLAKKIESIQRRREIVKGIRGERESLVAKFMEAPQRARATGDAFKSAREMDKETEMHIPTKPSNRFRRRSCR